MSTDVRFCAHASPARVTRYRRSVRWELLFADLEAQLAAGAQAEQRWQVAELTRAERAGVHLADRLRAAVGVRVQLDVGDGEPDRLEGALLDATPTWVLLDVGGARRALVPLDAVRTVTGLPVQVAPPAGAAERRLGLGHALRALARDRVTVAVRTGAGEVVGRLERVGADHVDLTTVAPAGRWVAVPLAALRAVVSR
ncbi:hypothetical protein GCM10023113_34930 [Cellulomonas oligotrophica]|uniref:Uncharacterized protein n=1 Tax=Cellulomonas oligotrophica TaxID=931536 RepID=A0ABQ4DEK9_9CELL|nr:hypothetical protein Col01nite_33190 [Cellulomonas oligotrophica]